MRIPHELQPLARQARKSGWSICPGNAGHLRWVSPDGAVIHTPGSPSTNRARVYTRWKLRRAGLSI